ncbi:hypothetical protein A4A49_41161 [Nicotiana attenuata]|uniref:Uncharacterized protein n=1 Tax=Nicotiana attenuata TaxID=49451 RepID=A0A1J6JNV1_NICAT|nr:hypothetical protein A4A49_41161 [Nicotiana attenuata]
MASPNSSINVQETISTIEVVVVVPLYATTAAMENIMVEEPLVLTRGNRGRKPPKMVEEGPSAPIDTNRAVPTTSSFTILVPAPARKGKAAKASGKGKKEQEEPTTSEVLLKMLHLFCLVGCRNNIPERLIETFLLTLQIKHLLEVLIDCAWEGKAQDEPEEEGLPLSSDSLNVFVKDDDLPESLLRRRSGKEPMVPEEEDMMLLSDYFDEVATVSRKEL